MSQQSDDKFIQQARLNQLCLDYAGVGIFQISEDEGQILSANREACRSLGYSKEELESMTIFDIDPNFSKEQIDKWHKHRKKVRNKGTKTIETLHQRKDGSILPVEVTISYFEFEGSRFSFSFVKDISKRKEAENKLREREQLFRTTLYSIGDGVIICDQNGNIRNLNAVAEKLTGWTESEACGRPIEEIFVIINEDTRKFVANPLKEVFAKGCIVGLANHTLLISRSGKEIPITDSGAPIFSEDSTIVGAVLVFRDQTEERRHQNELKTSRNYYSSLLNNLPGMAFRCLNEIKWPMKYVSAGCKKLTGYSHEEFVDHQIISFGSLIHPEDRIRVWDKVQAAITEESSYQIEYRIITKEKEEKWVWEQGKSVPGNINQEITLVEGFITDITEHKLMEHKLKENDRLKTSFLQNMSHEIRTPLNAILGFSELIKQPGLPERERNEYINIVQNGGEKLLAILNNVLELSRIETGTSSIEKSDFSLNKILNELHALFLPQATAKGLKLELLNSHEETTIKSDYTKLIQILTNLINNALKYTEKGKIEFGYENKNDQILFFVKDTGMGISKEQQSKVFDRFYRSDDPRFLIHDGVGLGLSICLGFIEILNGEIWLESEPGKGTNFYFSLPRS